MRGRAPGSTSSAINIPIRFALEISLIVAVATMAYAISTVWGQDVELIDGIDEPTETGAVYPPHGLVSVRFDHAEHVRVADCAQCHGLAATSDHSAQLLNPTMEQCGRCHEQASDVESTDACAFCHEGYRPLWPDSANPFSVRAVRFPLLGPTPSIPFRPNLHFSHLLHEEWECTVCHQDEASGHASLPSESLCLDCHATVGAVLASGAVNTCAGCHPTQQDGRLTVYFDGTALVGPQNLVPASHDEARFFSEHGLAVEIQGAALCEQCHLESECLRCHTSAMTNAGTIHPAGFIGEHALEARQDGVSCMSCHNVERFCVDCHLDAGVTDLPGFTLPNNATIHPTGWTELTGGEHALAAQRNIVECAGCHVENSCTSCHATFNPHGPEFFSRCDELLQRQPSMCGQCHGADLTQLEAQCF